MKTFFLFIAAVFTCCTVGAQSAGSAAASYNLRFAPLDKSPLDVIYFPANYPMLKIQDKVSEPPVARLIYSRPQKDDRKIFGDLVPFGKVWRTGANNATIITFTDTVMVGSSKLSPGKYGLLSIPNKDEWTVIFSKQTNVTSPVDYKQESDAARINVKTSSIQA